jgi:hypothetical protein
MATYTLAEQLENVQDAIAAIESGAQSVRAQDGRQLSRANLDTLYKREAYLQNRIAREAEGQATLRTRAEF